MMQEIGNVLGALFGWVGLCWATLLLLAGVFWLFGLVYRYFDRNITNAQEAVMWRRHEVGVQKVCSVASDDDFDLAVAIVLNGSRQWNRAVSEGRVIEWECWEESQPTGIGDFLLRINGSNQYVIACFNGRAFIDEDGQSISGVMAWSKLPCRDASTDGGE